MKKFLHIFKLSAIFLVIVVFAFSDLVSSLPQMLQQNKFAESLKMKEALAAAPAYRASGTFTASTAAITPPYPASMAANDVCLLVVESENQAITLTTPNGFIQVPTWSPQNAGTAATDPASRLAVFWKRTIGGDAAPVVADSGNHTTGQIHCFSGVATSGDPWNTGAGGNDSAANDTTGTIPGSTTSIADTLVVLITSSSNNATATTNCSGWINADLASLTERTDNTNTAGLGGGHCLATGTKAVAGAYTTTTVTMSVTTFKGAISLALRPSPNTNSYTNGTESALNFANCATTGCGARITTGSDQTVTITGVYFGVVSTGSRANCAGGAGTGCVRIATYTIPDVNVIAWTDTSIQFQIPAAISVFGGSGTTCGGADGNGLCITAASANDPNGALQFFVFPNITSTSPTPSTGAREGDSVTMTGNRFGTSQGTGSVKFQNCAGSDVTATITAWGDTSISLTVPLGISDADNSCDILITRDSGTGSKTDTSNNTANNLGTFVILPDITNMIPCAICAANSAREYDGAGDTDGIILLQGNHLGTAAGSVDFTGGINFPVHATAEGSCTTGGWAAGGASVCVEVNNTIADTTNTGTITLTRTGDSKTDAITLTSVLPEITSNTPSSSIIGDKIKITGKHFCQAGCPASPPTAGDTIVFGTTATLSSDFVATGGSPCSALTQAWNATEICVKVPAGTPLGSQPTKVTSNTTFNSNTQAFSVISSVPNDPDVGPGASKGQFKSDGTTAISIGGGTNQTTVVFKMLMSAGVNTTLEPQVEVDPVATAFAADNIIAGTAVAYTGTPVTGSVTITTFADATSYHWRARVRNTNTNEFSNWISFGGNTENPPTNPAATDFYVDTAGPLISGICVVDPSASSCDGSSPTDIQAQIRWSTNESADEQVAYGTSCPTGQASAAATFSALANKQPANPTGSGASHSQIISGLTGATTYQYMIRSSDSLGNVSYNPSTANTCSTFTTSAAVTRIMKTNTFYIQTSKDAVLSNAYPKTFSIFIPESNTLKTNITFKSIMIEISGITVGTGGSGITISPNLNSGGAMAHTLADPGLNVAVPWAISYPATTIYFDCPGCASASNTLNMAITGGGDSTIVSAKAIITYFYTP